MRRLVLWEDHVGTLLNLIRRRGARMTREQLDQLRDRYLAATFDEIEERLALSWEDAGLDEHRFGLSDEAHRLSAGLANLQYELALPLAREMLPQAGQEPETVRLLARRLMEAKLESIKAELAALSGEPLRLPQLSSPTPPAPASPERQSPTPRISELAKQYGDERVAGNHWSARTEKQFRGYLEVLGDLLGDPCIGAVTKEDIRGLGHDLVQLPAHATKRFPGLSARQAIAAAGAQGDVERLSPNSVNSYYQTFRSFFAWAEQYDHLQKNPASVLRDVKAGRARDDRDPFDDSDLVAYFAVLQVERLRCPYLYWIPYIMAFSGCRLAEAAQLCKEDVREEGGLWIFDFNDDHEKRLKNKSSRRKVPLHPRLVELGLLELIERAPEGFLWPPEARTATDATGSAIDRLQKRLSTRLRKHAGITNKKKTAAHSFRHTVPARLKAHSVPEYQIAEILGHENESQSTGRYGSRTDLAQLLEVIRLLQLPI